jgi:1,4-alpha-glucan branching enzyme
VTSLERRIEGLVRGEENDPFALLGMHRTDEGVVVRAFRPRAETLELIDERSGDVVAPFERIHPEGVFSLSLREDGFAYRLRERSANGVRDVDDPYRFAPLLGDIDVWLIAEGRHLYLYDVLGAHVRTIDGVRGAAFAVWAPNARRVSVVGDFNAWDGRMHAMRFRKECGVWEIFIPGEFAGARYKYEIAGAGGGLLPLRSDPLAFASELRPANASIVVPPSPFLWSDEGWLEARAGIPAADAPLSIYEVHLGSWRRTGAQGERMFSYRMLADELIPYVRDLGFTHVELLPVTEHPFDGSWGYQTTGQFAPTSRHGAPDDFRAFVDRAHAAGIGVILDWVPAHFPIDAHGLGNFDGTHLYEHADPRKGFHYEWGTYVYNLGRSEVANFLIASALFWLREYHIDGLRVDAVSSLLYLDYGRKEGQWIPNVRGDNENLEATAFLRTFNETVHAEVPRAITAAEEASAWPKISAPVSAGGLGFDFKWNMGWMHDTLRLFTRDPIARGHHWNELTFSLMYAFDEHYILPFSHDEVVHLKHSLVGRMPGNDDARFAALRLLYAYLFAHPGKKLLFMGAEFAQEGEWSEARSLDWHLLADPRRQGIAALVRDLNALYTGTPALHACDNDWGGFEWIEADDATRSVAAFLRKDPASGTFAVVVLNLSGISYDGYRVGVPLGGTYRELINTDSAAYGGANRGNLGEVEALEHGTQGRPFALELYLPPQSALLLEPV